MSPLVYEILMTAHRMARDQQIQRLATLKARLATLYPNNPEEIMEALRTWAEYLVKTRDNT